MLLTNVFIMGRNSFCSHFFDKTDLPVNNLRYFHPYKEIRLKCRTSLLYLQIYLTYTQHPNMKGLVIKYKQQNFQIASTEGIVSCLSVIASKERLMLENGGNGQAAGCMNHHSLNRKKNIRNCYCNITIESKPYYEAKR